MPLKNLCLNFIKNGSTQYISETIQSKLKNVLKSNENINEKEILEENKAPENEEENKTIKKTNIILYFVIFFDLNSLKIKLHRCAYSTCRRTS